MSKKTSLNKQAENGVKGQSRTEAILADKFWLHWMSVDIEGRDVMVEPRKSNLQEIKDSKKIINTLGIVQSKFFEGNNEVKIAREYVEDIEGICTDFFALIHTDSEDSIHQSYFFTAEEISNQFYLRKNKKGKQYYIFKLTKQREYTSNKNLAPKTINSIISDLLSKTDEYRNQSFIRKIESKFIELGNRYQHNDVELWKSVENKHITDKLLILLSTYSGFRHILAWRQTEKLSFYDKINTHTYYQNFILKTNNNQIISFFENIKIGSVVTLKSAAFFEEVEDAQVKVQKIIELFNASNINTIDYKGEKINIKLSSSSVCDCEICSLKNLNFYRANYLAKTKNLSSDCWNNLSKGFTLFELGKYDNAIEKLTNLPEILSSTKDFVPSFIANYNLEILRRYVVDEKVVNLYYELLKLPINIENREILQSISEHTLLNDYLRTIDDLYLKIKDFKQRYNNTSTLDYLNRQRVKLIECLSFFEGNRIILIDEFKVLCEKHIECCVVSYSMQAQYRNHLNAFDDFIIKTAINNCEPINLLGYLQRNNIDSIKYLETPNGYFDEALNNFFSNDNVEFLKNEIIYIDNRTNNPDLRRKTIRIFNNICILLSYIEITLSDSIMSRIIHFISELDFRIDEVSSLAHPILKKPEQFSNQKIYELIKILLNKNDPQGYLLANCLFCLEEKKVVFEDSQNDLVSSIITATLENPDYASLRYLPNVFNETQVLRLKEAVFQSLSEDFDQTLYYEAVKSKCIDNPLTFFNQYCLEIEKIMSRQTINLSDHNSAFTGISKYVIEKMNHFIECIYLLEEKQLFETELIGKICGWNDYFNFLLNIDNFNIDHKFDINWLIDISSGTLFRKMNNNKDLKHTISKQIPTTHNKYLHQIFFKYFM